MCLFEKKYTFCFIRLRSYSCHSGLYSRMSIGSLVIYYVCEGLV